MRDFYLGNDGYNLIELIVGLFIFSVVGLMASTFYQRVGAFEKEIEIRSGLSQDMDLLAQRAKTDMKYLAHNHLSDPGIEIPPSDCQGDLCRKIQLERIDSSGSEITVTYENRCVEAGELLELNSALASESVLEKSICLKVAQCSGGELPEAWVVLNQLTPNRQDLKAFRLKMNYENKSTSYLGSAVCFEKVDLDRGQLKMTIESIYKYSGILKFISSSHYLTPSQIGLSVEVIP